MKGDSEKELNQMKTEKDEADLKIKTFEEDLKKLWIEHKGCGEIHSK